MSGICSICFVYEETTVKCVDPRCTTKICHDCLDIYFKHCLSEKLLAKCINDNCKYYIISDSFNKDARFYHAYKELLTNAFIYIHEEDINIQNMQTELIEKIRNERKKYIKIFPESINLVINVALAKKLDIITDSNKKYINDLTNKINRLCINSQCHGKLNSNFECVLCSTKFCKKCERSIKKDHICNNEDIQSLEIISGIMKCPNCLSKIERSEGCNTMKCIQCMSVFDYASGDLILTESIEKKPETKLTFDFKENYSRDINVRLYKIEQYAVIKPNSGILKQIMKFKKGDISIEHAIRVFETFLKEKIRYIKFVDIVNKVIELHGSNELTLMKLDDLFESLRT